VFLQELDRAIAGFSEALGAAKFESEWRLGRAMSRESLIVLALEGVE
jgi:hypothetical protein